MRALAALVLGVVAGLCGAAGAVELGEAGAGAAAEPGVAAPVRYLQPLTPPPDPLAETRICGAPARDARGEIRRSAAVVAAFRRIHPCPSTGLTAGACPGWAIDHQIPLAVGGCDAVSNMGWLPLQIKACAGTVCKDRWERKVYAPVPQIVNIER